GQFSLGMKQRLGIATALLHSPSVLVLDEPTNGLDPSGMVEMRELLKRLNKEHGITILISSHLLSEIEKLVTEVGIINQGKMLFEGSLGELMQRQRSAGGIRLNTSNNAAAVERLIAQGLDARQEQDKIVLPLLARSEIAQLNRELVQHQLDVYEISTVESDLESIFMTLTHS
ncbi:MAG TPA: multidrug ABC transporter ATP-binding protein, partial [Runella sp.]|nr:multidrug ABC transporter ATP-binding protein [Runella sp.]